MTAKKKRGRPTKRRPEIIAKLEEAFSLGATVEEACFYAGISKQTFYAWNETDKGFSDRMLALRHRQILKALQTIDSALDDDIKVAQWFLEKRHPDFKPKKEVAHQTTDIIPLIIDKPDWIEDDPKPSSEVVSGNC